MPIAFLSVIGLTALCALDAQASPAQVSRPAAHRPVRKGPWTELPPISAPGYVNAANDKPAVVARRGLSVLVWRDSNHASSGGFGDLWSWTRRGRQVSWGAPTKLSGRASEHNLFRMSAGPTGLIVLCWLDKIGRTRERIRLRVMQPSSTRWSRPFTVANIETHHSAFEGVQDLRVSVGRSTGTVAWLLSDGSLEERRFSLTGQLAPIGPISLEAENVEFHLATTPTEEVIAAYGHASSSQYAQYAVSGSPGPQAPFGPPIALSSIPEVEGATFFVPSYGNEIAANRFGAVAAIWSTYIATEQTPGRNMLYVDVRPPGSTEWPPPTVLSSNEQVNFDFEAQVQADSRGRFRVLAATNLGAASRELAVFTSDPIGGAWTSKALVPSLGLNDAFRLAAGGSGQVAVLYERGIGHQFISRLFARVTRGRWDRWGHPVLLDRKNYRSTAGTGDTLSGGNQGPSVTVTPGGGALVAWVDGNTIRSAYAMPKKRH